MLTSHVWPLTAECIDNQLAIGGCRVAELGAKYGTPLYIFDEETLREACRAYRNAFEPYPGTVHFSYASKALLNLAVAHILIEEGFGFDVVSLGEMKLALHAGARPNAIHLHGNAKPRFELEEAIKTGIGLIAVDNLDEASTLAALCAELEIEQKIILRIEPAVAAETHKKIQTGQKGSKFGLALTEIDGLVSVIQASPYLKLVGLHFHLGSQLFDMQAYQKAIRVVLDLMVTLQDRYGIAITQVSPGGGLAAAYRAEEEPPNPADLAGHLIDFMVDGCRERRLALPTLILEPGRSISARAGVALYEVIGSKPIETAANGATRYVHVDGGMGDNLRPALYSARYTAVVANRVVADEQETVHISGRFCESGDLLAKDIVLPKAEMEDLIAFATAGAYTLSMANNYNLVPRPAVVMIKDGSPRLIQRRETFIDLIQRDV
ncbi:MAG: diaminopimelate decarboxylase [Chloroflexota bacterium]